MSQDESSEATMPFHLMPLAAILGTYTLISSIYTLITIYRNLTYKSSSTTAPLSTPLKSRKFLFILISIALSTWGYTQIVAHVSTIQAVMSPFNPYEILNLPEGTTNTTLIKSTYRAQSKVHHPDKGGDESRFQLINAAYKTLTDDVARENWARYGHPDGPQRFSLDMALPPWLLRPKGTVAVVLIVMYIGLFVGIISYVVRYVSKSSEEASRAELASSVSKGDVEYLIERLSWDISHLDIMMILATSPENIKNSEQNIAKIAEWTKKKLEIKAKEKKDNLMDLSGDWGDDDNEQDEETKAKIEAAKKEEMEMQRQRYALAQATGNLDLNLIKMEGVDDGVLGQGWVEGVLTKKGLWPPKLSKFVTSEMMENDAIKRNLVMTVGRLNAMVLNDHPDLKAASQKGLIDSNYFKNTVQYRQRCGLLLEASLRVASTARSYPLAKTLIETVTMFKIGCSDPTDHTWFHKIIKAQYDIIPLLDIGEKKIETEGEDEIATGDTAHLKLKMDRIHAENFTRAKLEQAKKQNIPPQAILSTYQEGWWVLLHAEKIANLDDTEYHAQPATLPQDAEWPDGMSIADDKLASYHTGKVTDVLLACQPTIVSNVAQKRGWMKIPFKVPNEPGKYKFYADVMSQEFLGCNQSFELEIDVLDVDAVKRKQKEEEDVEDENKKDK
eukprot:CAMPEP_0172507908 /NCGR_PEP_ID=MMETSP1066-20121228/207482_1 /TAXON_ID=671091 /ORGANISM="Coscinodiscus wailesii, Strain CCMP2513" /LENGTH=670 /DNA_ID=CAMNT_0013285633 /DNA_START=110 /DNA_END=2122 /DNA_ORIENTATION=+